MRIDLTSALRLAENVSVCFQGPVKVGAFDISGARARDWLQMPLNPNGRNNADVLRPWVNGTRSDSAGLQIPGSSILEK